MYEQYWNLKCKPFESGRAKQFYYPSEIHQGALLKLRYSVEQRRGAAALSGAAGLGKSLIVANLLASLPDEFQPRVHITFPQMPTEQLMAFLATEIAGEIQPPTALNISVKRIHDVLQENALSGKHAVLAVDEAHLIDSTQTLEALRLLLNFETDGQPHLTLLLIGQPQLLANLERNQLGQRVDVRSLLRPLSSDETASYVSHRMTAAGAERTIFSSAAMDTIHELAGGIPRKINRLCDLSLLICFADQKPAIGPEDVESVCEEMVAIVPEASAHSLDERF